MKKLYYNGKNKEYARQLRREQTPQENHLWYDFLRNYSVRFHRQKQIGDYIVDFYCAKAKLVIELDGSQHYEEEAIKYDKERTEYIEKLGLFVLRFTNRDINTNFANICEMIDYVVKNRMK